MTIMALHGQSARRSGGDQLQVSLSLALRQDGRRRFQPAHGLMANLTADHLIRRLKRANYVVMEKPARAGHSTSGIRAG
jgi:hypothetical protein